MNENGDSGADSSTWSEAEWEAERAWMVANGHAPPAPTKQAPSVASRPPGWEGTPLEASEVPDLRPATAPDYKALMADDARKNPLNGRMNVRTKRALEAIAREVLAGGKGATVPVRLVLPYVPRWQLDFLRLRGFVTMKGQTWGAAETVTLTGHGARMLYEARRGKDDQKDKAATGGTGGAGGRRRDAAASAAAIAQAVG